MSILDGFDDEVCGLVAAIVASLSYGSFGAAVKETKKIPNVHPLVLQSYKTIVLFACCWFVVLFGEDIRWMPKLGILSGFLWVCGSTCGIYAIRNAGMAVAVGTWSSVMVMINFTWGILIFKEPINNLFNVCCAFLLLGYGLIGMSRYSSPSLPQIDTTSTPQTLPQTLEDENTNMEHVSYKIMRNEQADINKINDDSSSSSGSNNGYDRVLLSSDYVGSSALTRRQLGIAAAAANGLLSGSSLIPVHYAKKDGFGGTAFIISFSFGSMIANIFLWVLYYIYMVAYACLSNSKKSSSEWWWYFSMMPKWYLRQLWLPGFTAGLLVTVGKYGSIIATTYLGQSIGNSLVQSKIVISGLWGICYYKEIKQSSSIVKWFLAATTAVIGILWLGYEHKLGMSSLKQS